jgi:hypothetical protein
LDESQFVSSTLQANLLIGLWGATRQLVALSSTHKKPYEWGSFIAPVSNYITEISTVYEVEAPKSDESVGIQLHALSIASQAFKWVIVRKATSSLSFRVFLPLL